MSFAEYGDKLIALGEAMKNPDTTITELTELAFDADLSLQFRLVNNEEEGDGQNHVE